VVAAFLLPVLVVVAAFSNVNLYAVVVDVAAAVAVVPVPG